MTPERSGRSTLRRGVFLKIGSMGLFSVRAALPYSQQRLSLASALAPVSRDVCSLPYPPLCPKLCPLLTALCPTKRYLGSGVIPGIRAD